MERKNKIKISKGFFSTERPTISTKEALKDVIPAKWENKHNKNTNKNLNLIKKN